jgi:hypothetical protein
MTIDVCVPYWDPLPVLFFTSKVTSPLYDQSGPVNFRKLIVGGIREEDLVVFLERHEVAAYSPVILVCRCLG